MMRASFPIPSPPTSMPCGPRVLPSLLAAASRNAARGFADLQLFEIGAAFDSGMPEAQTDRRRRHPHRQRRARLAEGAAMTPACSTVKADLLAALEAITGAPMSAPITQGAPGWYHPGRSGTIAHGAQDHRPVRRTASQDAGRLRPERCRPPVSRSSWTRSPRPKPRARPGRCSRPRPSRRSSAISPLWWMRKVRGGRDRQGGRSWPTAT